MLLYLVNQFMYIQYRALSNSSHVSNSALILSHNLRSVHVAICTVDQLFILAQVVVVRVFI